MVPYNPIPKKSYHPPHQVSTLNSQQYYHLLSHHNLHAYHNSIGSVAMSSIPRSVIPPPPPPQQKFPLDQSTISAQTGDVGQYFGG